MTSALNRRGTFLFAEREVSDELRAAEPVNYQPWWRPRRAMIATRPFADAIQEDPERWDGLS